MTDFIPITIRLSPEKALLLNEIANKEDRSRSYLLRQAVDRYLEMHQAWVKGIEEAIHEADAGKTIPIDEVFAELRDSQ